MLVPFRHLLNSWKREVDKWWLPFQVHVKTYDRLRADVTEPRPDPGGKQSGKHAVSRDKAFALGELYDATIVDESSRIGNRESQIFAAVCAVSWEHKIRLALSGTPFGKNPMKLWSQLYFVDHGLTLGRFRMYRACMFRWQKRWRFGEWKFQAEHLPALQRLVRNRSISYRAEECLDMPAQRRLSVSFSLPKPAVDEYQRLQREMEEVMAREVATGLYQETEVCFTRL